MAKTHDLCVKVGTYQKDGKEKNRYLNVGAIIDSGNGPFIILNKTFNPAGIADDKDSVILSMFEAGSGGSAPAGGGGSDEDVPF